MEKERDISLVEETESAIRQGVMKLKTREERQKMLHRLRECVLFMSEVQALPQLVRERFYEAFFPMFRYLRANRQLGREAHRFDVPVLDKLLDVISKILHDDGV